jgi:hypothetical protein
MRVFFHLLLIELEMFGAWIQASEAGVKFWQLINHITDNVPPKYTERMNKKKAS